MVAMTGETGHVLWAFTSSARFSNLTRQYTELLPSISTQDQR